jgi:Skp family chaperone for outer membrane proteins
MSRFILYKILFFSIYCQVSIADDSIFFIDTDAIVQKTQEYTKIKQTLNQEFSPKFNELSIELKKINDQKRNLNKAEVFFSNKKTNEELKIEENERILSKKTDDLNYSYRVKEENLKILIIKKIVLKVKEYAIRNKISFVLEKNSIVIYKNGQYKDISKDIINAIDF